MAVISELLRSEEDGTISFGDYTLSTKAKLDNFEHQGDLYKVKTCQEITKLERNGMFVYESVPGTAVEHLKATDTGMEFSVEGAEDAQVTVELEDEAEYDIVIDGADAGRMKTNLGGKLSLSVELGDAPVKVSVAATTAFPAGNTQWIAPNSLHARSVFSFIPPLPMITRTPDSFTNSYSNFSIRILVVGPTETISNLSFSRGRMIGPAWKIAASFTSTGSSLPSSTRRL